uniref:Proline rich 33 n=1 Tax=Mola mola TaxID=94237 RepID=A0A3Q3X1E3_MOLML
MAIAYSAFTQLGMLSQQYPPPLLPKPRKDNVKLQKLLKRSARKKASAQVSQSAIHFRTSLSPVNEASPDLEHSDHSTPPKTPETPFSLYNAGQPPRFTVRPLYQHVASPYPQRAARFSFPTVATPSYSYAQHLTTPPEEKKPFVVPFFETHNDLKTAAIEATRQPKHTRPVPTPYTATGGQSLIRPLTVLTPFVKPKSPRPTFKATDRSRSPKPMFDVPQIKMYTASTSYYETNKTKTSDLETKRGTTPTAEINKVITKTSKVERDTSAPELKRVTPMAEIRRLTPTAEIQRVTPTAEIKRVTPTAEIRRLTPTAEIRRVTPTAEIKRVTPTAEIKRVTPTAEIKRVTPTAEIKRVTPTAEIKRVTPTAEIKRVTPTAEIKRVTPTAEIKRVTPTAEIKRVTPTAEIKRVTPTAEIKRVTPTAEIRAKTPTYESQTLRRTGRPKTPSQHLTRTTPEPKTTETIVNGDIHSDMTPAAKADQQSVTKSEPDLTRKIPTTPAESQTPSKMPADPTALLVTSHGCQRPRTPTYEASRLRATSPGYKRPKTPTYGTSPPEVSPAAFQRPKIQTQVGQKPKSGYRGLTPRTPLRDSSACWEHVYIWCLSS